jgi:hypothetical protein
MGESHVNHRKCIVFGNEINKGLYFFAALLVDMSRIIYTRSFSYNGFSVPALQIAEPLVMDAGTMDIPVNDHFAKSCPMNYRTALYSLGRDMKLGKDTGNIPGIVMMAAEFVYSHAHECTKSENHTGVVHNDIAVFLPWAEAPKGMHRPRNKKFRFVQYYVDVDEVERWHDHSIPVSYGKMENLMMPEGATAVRLAPWIGGRKECHFVVPTKRNPGGDCEWYNHVTGTPLDSVKGKEKALKRIMEYEGLSEEQAMPELSSFFMKIKDQSVVPCTYGSTNNGPLAILMDIRPWHLNPEYGSYNISKLLD